MSREPAIRRDVPLDRRWNAKGSDRHNSRRSLHLPEQISPVEAASLPPADASYSIQPNHIQPNHIQPNHIQTNHIQTRDIQTRDIQANSNEQSCWRDWLRLNLWRLVRHPATLLTVSWVVCIGVAGIAAQQMIQVNPIELQSKDIPAQPSVTPSPSQQSTRLRGIENRRRNASRENNGDALPLTSLVAVAISCAAGSFILCRRSTPRKPERRLHLSSRHRPTAASLPVAPVPQALPHPKPSQPVEVPTSVRATLVSDTESHPLDWDEPSLADNLDLRQHRPLSHWL